MEQYIPKSALIAEIERLKSIYDNEWDDKYVAKYTVLDLLKSNLDTIEVKEVDLEKEIDNYISSNFFGSQTMGFFANRTKEEPNDQDIALCARHFFELGLKAQHNSIGIPNIDDIFEEEGIDPNSKDAKIFKECYYMALERLKA